MIIGKRTLILDTTAGERTVEVRLYEPESADARWVCRYEIAWPEGVKSGSMQGADSLAAIHNALLRIGTDLYNSSHHQRRKLWWVKPMVGYGFPVPKGARDILIGQDQAYFGLDEAPK